VYFHIQVGFGFAEQIGDLLDMSIVLVNFLLESLKFGLLVYGLSLQLEDSQFALCRCSFVGLELFFRRVIGFDGAAGLGGLQAPPPLTLEGFLEGIDLAG
jgi:hypothetical protein